MSQQTTLASWVESTPYSDGRPGRARRKVVSLFDRHGLSLRPWQQRGFECLAINPKAGAVSCPGVTMRTAPMATIGQIRRALPAPDEIEFLVATPPCRDLCAAGARWWKRKSERNPNFQSDAARFLWELYNLLNEELAQVPYTLLLPASPRIRSLFKQPDFAFSPHEYGGYLGPDAPHPLFPDTIPTQDRYTKKTFVFSGHHAQQPWKRPVVPVFTDVRLKSGIVKRISPVLASRSEREARHVTPLGFSTAICCVHAPAPPQSRPATHSDMLAGSSAPSASSATSDSGDIRPPLASSSDP